MFPSQCLPQLTMYMHMYILHLPLYDSKCVYRYVLLGVLQNLSLNLFEIVCIIINNLLFPDTYWAISPKLQDKKVYKLAAL